MDIDVTLLFQLTLLAGLVATLGRTLFAPLLHVIEQRHHKIHGLRHEIDRLQRLAQADEKAYIDKMQVARRQAHAAREALRTAGRDEARAIVTEARAQVSQAHARMREQVRAAAMAAQKVVQNDVAGLADLLVGKLTSAKERA